MGVWNRNPDMDGWKDKSWSPAEVYGDVVLHDWRVVVHQWYPKNAPIEEAHIKFDGGVAELYGRHRGGPFAISIVSLEQKARDLWALPARDIDWFRVRVRVVSWKKTRKCNWHYAPMVHVWFWDPWIRRYLALDLVFFIRTGPCHLFFHHPGVWGTRTTVHVWRPHATNISPYTWTDVWFDAKDWLKRFHKHWGFSYYRLRLDRFCILQELSNCEGKLQVDKAEVIY